MIGPLGVATVISRIKDELTPGGGAASPVPARWAFDITVTVTSAPTSRRKQLRAPTARNCQNCAGQAELFDLEVVSL